MPCAVAFASTGYKGAKGVMHSLQQCQRKLDVTALAALLTCHLGKDNLHPHLHSWNSLQCWRGGLLLGTSLSGCGSKLTACEIDNFSSIVSIGFPSSALAELMESSSPAWTGNRSLCLN